MIDKNTGNLTLDSGKAILSTTSLGEIKDFKLSEVQEEQDMGNGWVHFTVRNVEVSGTYFIITFIFHEKALESVLFVINDSPFDLNIGWESWSEQKERNNAVLYNNWLNKEIGTSRNFSWGNVWATYDPKSGGSSMGIRYNK